MVDPSKTPTQSGDPDLKSRLTDEQYQVTQCSATERAFTGKYWNTHDDGIYRCVVCNTELFRSEEKFDSGSGWPSFWRAAAGDRVKEVEDRSHGMVRIEVQCANCGAHLGHLFDDGPAPTGQRYCINSAALDLEKR
jgi:peptide-methionine (R)-S-oxide reductase